MRILHLDHSPVLGGAERSVLELVRSQRASGHDAVVGVGRDGSFRAALRSAGQPSIDLGWSPRYTDSGRDAGLTRMALSLPSLVVASMRLRLLIDRLAPDVVHAHTPKSQLVAAAALVGSRIPLVWHLRDDVPARPILRRAMRLGMSRVDHAVALSRWVAGHYRSVDLVPRSGDIGVVPSGIDPTGLSDLPTPWLDGDRGPVVGYVGQIVRWKAPHLLIEAAELLSDCPEARFVVIGDVWFPQADHGYGAWLDRRIAESPMHTRIRRLGTRTPPEAFGEIDVLVHTSTEPEPFGRVIVEAMVAHRPVAAFSRGAVPEIADGTTASVASGSDAAALADAIRVVITDRARSQRLVAAAAVSAERFTPARVAAAMDDAYRVVVG